MKDFGDIYTAKKYFPTDGEVRLDEFGADVYLLSGQFNSNLALLTRTPFLNRRLLQSEAPTTANLEKHLRRVTVGFAKHSAEYDAFILDMVRMLKDYHDYQHSAQVIARGKSIFIAWANEECQFIDIVNY